MGDSEKEEVLIRREKSMCYVNTIHYRVQVRLKSVMEEKESNMSISIPDTYC